MSGISSADVANAAAAAPGSANSPTRRTRRAPGENRKRLLTAGTRVFGSHGYHGASTAAIAALAGVPQPHVYASFHTKQELFFSCAEAVADALRNEPAVPLSDQDRQTYAAFIFQALAAVHEPKLQPMLATWLGDLRGQLGAEALLTYLRSHAQTAISTL